MRLGAYAATVGSMEQQKRLDVIANNVANANTPGFKKDNVHFSNFLGQVTYTNLDQGPIRETGNKLDVAISGDGFFKVQTDKGVVYSRAGNLTVDNSKNLVTREGFPVLGRNGPITIDNPQDLRIDETGQIFDMNTANPKEGEKQIDSLDIVKFPPEAAMKKVQNGYFEPAVQGVQTTAADNVTVRQGALEGANFNPVEEMVRMVETMRNFESYQKTMQIFDRDLDGQLIQKLSG